MVVVLLLLLSNILKIILSYLAIDIEYLGDFLGEYDVVWAQVKLVPPILCQSMIWVNT